MLNTAADTPYGLRAMLLLLVLAVVAGFLYEKSHDVPYAEAENIAEGIESFSELQDRFASLTEAKGAPYAFEVLRRAKLPPNSDIHFLGHTIGDELYKQRGIEGITDCTPDFRNACSHSIVIGAYIEFGDASLPMIRDACKKAPGGKGAYTMCYHGMGHGVFAFYGYDLERTVAECEKTGTETFHNQEYTECVGGAIMELVGGGSHDPELILRARERYLSETDPLSPCADASMPEEVQDICLIYLTPHLWEVAGIDLGRPDPEQFPAAFEYCNVLSRKKQWLRDACFGAFGKEFVILPGMRDLRRLEDFTDEEFALAASWCELTPEEDGQRACISHEISSVFWGGENDPATAFRFCGLVEKASLKKTCYEGLATDISRYIEKGVQRQQLCAKLPNEFQTTCNPGANSLSWQNSILY